MGMWRVRRSLQAAGAAGLIVLACAALTLGTLQASMQGQQHYQAALARWQARSFLNYRIVVVDGTCQMDYEVRAERVAWGYEMTCGRGNARSVTNLLELIRSNLAPSAACMGVACICEKATWVDARYHEQFGYPLRIVLTTSAWPNWHSAEFWRRLTLQLQNPCGSPTRRVINVVNFIPRRR